MEASFGKDMRYVTYLRDKMKNHNFMLSYRGFFSQDITKALLSVTEKKLDQEGADNNVKKKVFHIMVECLQNITKHTDNKPESLEADSLFMLGRSNDDYIIYSGNVIKQDKVNVLTNKLLAINAMSKEELKELYKMVIMSEGLSEKAGAGLGLIDIAKKSGSKLNFHFEPINEEFTFFSLRTIVPIPN